MSEAPKTVWVTTYALERGVVETSDIDWFTGDLIVDIGSGIVESVSEGHWHPTREAAVARAEEIRAAKIASLKRQIERLESLEF